MSQDISIQEGGISRQLGHINKLQIANSGGGESLWVPEDEVETQSLYVDKNGTYTAWDGKLVQKKTKKKNGKKKTTYVTSYDSDRACYGWDEVSVSIIDKVSGTKDGKMTTIGVDDEGFITETEIPSYIEIVKEPTTTHYVDGQNISIEGIQVKAYYENDTEWGDVPFEELSFEPTVAAPPLEDYAQWDEYDGRYVLSQPVYFSKTSGHVGEENKYQDTTLTKESGGDVYFITAYVNYDSGIHRVAAISDSPFTVRKHSYYYGRVTDEVVESSSAVYGEERVYYVDGSGEGAVYSPSPTHVTHFGSNVWMDILRIIKNGTITTGGSQEVTVIWDNENYSEPLTDTYEITVGQGAIPPND